MRTKDQITDGEEITTELDAAEPAEVLEEETEEAGEPAEGETPAEVVASYEPNFKYKVMKEEREIPEWARASIKDADTEKMAREIFERADGLEHVKTHRDSLQSEMQQVMPFVEAAQEALSFAEKGDLETFFEKVGLPEQAVLEYALQRVKLHQNPEQMAAHKQQRLHQQETTQFSQQREELQRMQQQIATQQREYELNTYIARPEVDEIAQALDNIAGAGTFRKEVIRRGQALAAIGQDPSVEQVVGEVLETYSKLVAGQPKPAAPAQPSPVAQKSKPTLPNTQSAGTSPVKKAFKSTDEMRAYAKKLVS